MLAAKHAMGSESEVEAENEQSEGQTNGQTTANPQLSYIEAYTNSIQAFTHLIAILIPFKFQAVESMLKLDRLRQEVAITNMLSRYDSIFMKKNSENWNLQKRTTRAIAALRSASSFAQDETNCQSAQCYFQFYYCEQHFLIEIELFERLCSPIYVVWIELCVLYLWWCQDENRDRNRGFW